MFGLLRPNTSLRISTSHYVVQKDRPTGERELFELAYTAKQEGSWAHIMGADIWINLTQDYQKEVSDSMVRYQVKSRPLANTIFDASLIFYHIHPKKAFDSAFKMMAKRRFFNLYQFFDNPFNEIGQRAYRHLLSTFHLPSVQDIKAAAYLEEKHGPGIFHVIISNVGATITQIRNPPNEESEKISIDEIVSNYKIIHDSISPFYRNNRDHNSFGQEDRNDYGVINERCEGRIAVADLTSIASLKFNFQHHLLLKWLASNTPLTKQLGNTPIILLYQIFGKETRRYNEFEKNIIKLTEIGDNASELKKLSTSIHKEVSHILTQFVGKGSSDLYAEYTIRSLREYYDYVERQYVKKWYQF